LSLTRGSGLQVLELQSSMVLPVVRVHSPEQQSDIEALESAYKKECEKRIRAELKAFQTLKTANSILEFVESIQQGHQALYELVKAQRESLPSKNWKEIKQSFADIDEYVGKSAADFKDCLRENKNDKEVKLQKKLFDSGEKIVRKVASTTGHAMKTTTKQYKIELGLYSQEQSRTSPRGTDSKPTHIELMKALKKSPAFVARRKRGSFLRHTELEQKAKQERICARVMKELIETERSYFKDLLTMATIWQRDLMNSKILPAQDVEGLFGNVDHLIVADSQLLHYLELEDRKPLAEKEIGTIFLKMKENLKVYYEYCAHHDKVVGTLAKLYETYPQLKELLVDITLTKKEVRNLDMEGFLIKPVQRICKYPLLLKEILKFMPKTHIDYTNMVSAQAMLQIILNEINCNLDSTNSNDDQQIAPEKRDRPSV